MIKPKIKDVHGVIYLEQRIRIGTVYELAVEIEDPEGKYTQLIKRLTGEHHIDTIVRELASVLTKQEIHEALQLLQEEGYLEDADVPPPVELSEQEIRRYKVNLNYFSTISKGTTSKYDMQVKLKNTRVLVLGMGGIGSNICLALAELGIGHVTAVDFDRVDLSNLNRQVLYSTNEVGELKVEVAKRRINAFNPDIHFETIEKRIESIDDVREIMSLREFDVVVNVADRPTGFIDFWVNQVCVETGVPYFAAVVAKHYGRVYSVIPGETACYNCMYESEVERSASIREEIQSIREEGFWTPNGALGPACMFHGYFVSYEILRYVLNTAPLLTGNSIYQINFMTFEDEYVKFDKRKDCPVCREVGIKKHEVHARS